MLRIKCLVFALVLSFALSIVQPKSVLAKDQDLAAEKVVSEHLMSIGSPEVLAKIKSRAFLGTTSAEFFQGMTGSMNGSSMLVSDGAKLGIVLKYGDINYPGEYFAFDGKDVSVGNIKPGQRSPLADFIFRYTGLMKEGLLGGELSGGWALLDLQGRQVEMKNRMTTVDGKRLYEIEYRPKNALRDMKIKMYFDPETFHHVRTEYRVRHQDDMSAATPADSNSGRFVLREGVADSNYMLVEKFDDFKKEGELTLPHIYSIDYSLDGQGPSFVGRWTLKANRWSFNDTLDEKLFKAQK